MLDSQVRNNDQNGTTKKMARYANAGKIIRYGAILLRWRLLLAAPAMCQPRCLATGDGGVGGVELLGLLVGQRGPRVQPVLIVLRRIDQRVGAERQPADEVALQPR